jgi:hypothetical protein
MDVGDMEKKEVAIEAKICERNKKVNAEGKGRKRIERF